MLKMSFQNENWQTTRSTVSSRINFMFNNELLSDVSFVVPVQLGENENKNCKKMIPAHKFVLAISSPVFSAMFFGELAEKKNSIVLPDCEYKSLFELFRFMYCDRVDLNEDNVLQVLYLAKKYIVPSLVDKCTEYLERIVGISNVFCIMAHAQNYEEKSLEEQCWKVIDRQTEDVLKTEGFATIERPLVEALVVRDSLNIKEVDLFKAVDHWATKECERLSVTSDGTMKRSVLGDKVVKAIRFPLMQREDFNKAVLGHEILTPQETSSMMEYYNSVSSSPVEFSQVKRNGLRQRCCRCIRSPPVSSSSTIFSFSRKECIYFAADRDIVLHGICIFGCKNVQYSVRITVKDSVHGSVMATKTGQYASLQMDELEERKMRRERIHGFDVLFDSPVFAKKGIWYHIYCHEKAAHVGPLYHYGQNGALSVQCPGVEFTFKNHLSLNKTDREEHIAQLIFSLE